MATRKTTKSDNQVETQVEVPEQESVMNTVEIILAGLNDLSILEIRQIIDGACQIIKDREDEEVNKLDQQIAELMAKRNQIRPQQHQQENGKKREIKALANPKNPEQKYTVGIRPKWLEDWLKETLGDKVSDKVAVYEQIAKWKNEQQ